MKILALEFSSRRRSISVFDAAAQQVLVTISDQAGHTTGMALLDLAMREAKLAPSAITRIGIGLGPGSYAGVRSAIAIAQGWQLARSTETVGISSCEGLAETVRQAGGRGHCTLVIDAQRGEMYHATFQLTEAGYKQLETLRLIPAIAVPKDALGPEVTGHFPSAESLARLAVNRNPVRAESLQPIYLRETSFVKAPPRKVIE